MPRRSCSVEVSAPCETVFDLVHDYERRLSWDTMLSEARLLDGAAAADIGVRSLCVGNWTSTFLPMETEYIQFARGRIAAVKLTNQPPFFRSFAATIKHEPTRQGWSRITYIYSFRSSWRLLEPIMDAMIFREVRARLRSIREFLSERSQ